MLKKAKVCTVGSIMNVKNAEHILSSGWADMVAFARPFVADPEFPRKYATGRDAEHVPCLRCGYCAKQLRRPAVTGCAVNPMRGHETQFPGGKLPKADEVKRIGIIGGGVAGIQAAMTLEQIGHDVTLYERSDKLGGNLLVAAKDEIKVDICAYKDYIMHMASKLRAKVLLNTEAMPEMIERENFDGLIIAVGAEPIMPPIPGIALPHVHWAASEEADAVKAGSSAVIIGGGTIGLETALTIARRGVNVTVVEMEKNSKALFAALSASNARMLLELLQQAGVKQLYGTCVKEIYEDSVDCENTEGVFNLKADTVLIAAGMKARKEIAESFIHCVPETEVHIIGDAVRGGTVAEAVNGAFHAAISLI